MRGGVPSYLRFLKFFPSVSTLIIFGSPQFTSTRSGGFRKKKILFESWFLKFMSMIVFLVYFIFRSFYTINIFWFILFLK